MLWKPDPTVLYAVAGTSFSDILPYIDSILKRHAAGVGQYFIVFDIDDTVLRGSGASVSPLGTGMYVLNEAVRLGVDIFYVTARPEYPENRLATYDDLHAVGLKPSFSNVYMRPTSSNTWEKVGMSKSQAVDAIARATGKKCMMTVGDQWTDHMYIADTFRDELEVATGNDFVIFRNPVRESWGVKLKSYH